MSTMYEVEATNVHAENPITRAGVTIGPKETKTLIVRDSSLKEVTGCAQLQTNIVSESRPPEPARVEDLDEEYQRIQELEAEIKTAQGERRRLADELASAKVAVDEARQADQGAKMQAVEEGKKPSAVKSSLPKAEAYYEDLAYEHHAAGLRLFSLQRDLHQLRETTSAAEHRAAQERERKARVAVEEAQAELRAAQNDADGKAKRPGEHRHKSRDAARQYRELEATGPSEG